jgi:hypothetical protein
VATARWIAAVALAVHVSACTPFGPDTGSVSFFVVMANETDGADSGPALDVEIVMTYSGRDGNLDFVPMSRESGPLAPGQTQVVQYLNGRDAGDATFEAHEAGAQTLLASATCAHREERPTSDSRSAALRGDAAAATGYSLACVDW